MNEKRTDLLYDLCDFRIYKTDEDMMEIEKYLEGLNIRLHQNYYAQLFSDIPKIKVTP